jgi:hypothetical protein
VDTHVPVYKPRSRNVIQTILKNHFSDFEKRYDDHYADKYGKYRIIRIKQAVEKFIECGDYSKGIARIKCTNPKCGYEYFRPFSCKSWYLCPSCNQKRLQLFAEHLSENVLFRLPHRQFVFTVPKILRLYFKYDRNLFEDVSRIIFLIIQDFYNESASEALKTASVVSYQSFGDLLRFNPHYHCLVLEGGIDETGSFHHIPIKDTASLTEVFRRRVIKLFVDRGLLDRRFALKILSWKHSGFSVDASVSIPASSKKARVNLSQYIIRHPVSLQKILYVCSNGTVIYKTKYNEYFKKNIKLFSADDFIAELTIHIPPKHKHLIRYYGLYSSRSKGKANKDGSLVRFTYRPETSGDVQLVGSPDEYPVTVSNKASRQSWARLIQKVYEVDPLICEKCGHEMRVFAIITDPYEVNKILECLKRNNAPPFDKVEIKAS